VGDSRKKRRLIRGKKSSLRHGGGFLEGLGATRGRWKGLKLKRQDDGSERGGRLFPSKGLVLEEDGASRKKW